VAVDVAVTLLGLDDPHMLPVKGPTAAVEVPTGVEDPLDVQPLSRVEGAVNFSCLYSSTLASQTWGMKREMVLWATWKLNTRLW